MATTTSVLTGETIDTASEEFRHECECRWLLENKRTRHEKHLYLYGVPDRAKLMKINAATGKPELAQDHAKLWVVAKPLMHWRGLEGADRLLADAKKIYDSQK